MAATRVMERIAWTAGIVILAVWGGLHLYGASDARREIDRFRAAAQQGTSARPDMSLWSPKRVQAWEEAMQKGTPAALAVLRIPRIKLEVPILAGTDELTLNRAVGLIEDTAKPTEKGNVGIAGHRDSFFRGLKDLETGDTLELELATGVERFKVEKIWIVQPEDVSVLDPTPTKALTLVTCYPFYFIGAAPQRYIVRAVPDPKHQ